MRSITTYVVLSVCLSVCSGVAIQVVEGAYAPPVRKYIILALTVLTVYRCSFNHSGGMICHDVFDCTANLVGQLNGNGQKGMLQIDAPFVEIFWLRHCLSVCLYHRRARS